MALRILRRSFMPSGLRFCRSFSLPFGGSRAFAPPPVVYSRRVVVTGLGMVTPLGCGVETTWKHLIDGKCGIRSLCLEDLKMNAFCRETQLNTFDQLTSKVAAMVPIGTNPGEFNEEIWLNSKVRFMTSKAFYTSKAGIDGGSPTEAVKELYDKMLKSVNKKRSMPPNAWLWSMIEKCGNNDDISLLFDILQNLRRFRLSNLRIHANFNDHLCREVSKACARVGALDFGKKTLWKHNVYGLTPSVASAHHLLSYAKNHNDTKLLMEVMKLIKTNDLPLQPGTADIVFSICCNTDNWELMNKYAKRFVKGGVKLRQTSFDMWMEFAAKRGDTESLWKIEKLRFESMKQHTLASGLSCAKGLLLERKPRDAATIIQALNQILSDAKKSGIKDELQKLVSEWPLEVIKHQKENDRKALAASLKSDIPAMVSDLLSMGLEANVNLEDLNAKDNILQ